MEILGDRNKLVTFNDPIHGTIQLHWLLGEIISTPEFQRLHYVKQLSSTFHVYPEANHTRFGHSIGTAYLAGKLVKHLHSTQPDLGITDEDVLCIQIAGLCHDLGHGPYSHLFDDQILPRIGVSDWKHEGSSCRMFERMRTNLGGQNPRIAAFLNNERCNFIKEMINPSGEDEYQGLNNDKHFMFQIISNKTSGVDVDKWDYFARDCHHLGIANSFNQERFIKFTRVIAIPRDGGKQHICAKKKEAFNLYGMFRARFALHKRACQHKRKNAVDHMICDALFAAKDDVEVDGVVGLERIVEEGAEDAFCKLDDRILLKIEHTTNGRGAMREAKDILERISNGNHYVCIGEKPLNEFFDNGAEKRAREEAIVRDLERELPGDLDGKIRVTIANFNYGRGRSDPIAKVWFYEEETPDVAVRVARPDVSRLLPSVFEENVLQVFCTDKALIVTENLKDEFKKWNP